MLIEKTVETIRGPGGGVNRLTVFKRDTRQTHSSSQTSPIDIVVYFVGDDVGHFHGCHPDILRFGTDDDYVAEHVLGKAFPTASIILIIRPCRYEAGFACYDNFIEYDRWDVAGDHIKYNGKSSSQWVYTCATKKACRQLYGLMGKYYTDDSSWTFGRIQ